MIKLKKEYNIRIETADIRRAIEKMAYDGEIGAYIEHPCAVYGLNESGK